VAFRELGSIQTELRAMLPDLRAHYGVEALWVFGSRARGEGREDSDLDLMVQVAPGRLSLWDYIGLEQEIGDRLGLKIDLVERRALRSEIGRYVLPEAVPV
jgi:uncharacterized protein